MTEEELLASAAAAIVEADERQAVALAHEAMAMGLDPVMVIDRGYGAGMVQVGERFERGHLFLPEVILASEAMTAAIAVLEQHLPEEDKAKKAGIAVLGTIEGDVHDIGKGIVATLFRVYGFDVVDLGRDVPVTAFVEKAQETGASIVGSSALMTTTMLGQKQLEKLLKKAGIRDQVKTMVGGAVVTQHWANKIGADAYAEDAQEAVAKALELVAARPGGDGPMTTYLTRMGDGQTVEATADDIRRDIVAGVEEAVVAGDVAPLTQEEQDRLFELMTAPGRMVAWNAGTRWC